MEAPRPRQSVDNGHVGLEIHQPPQDVLSLTGAQLDGRIRAGWDDWCELLDELLSTGGMLPSRELVGRVGSFFEDEYWRAEDARVEALRRQLAADGLHHRRINERSRGI